MPGWDMALLLNRTVREGLPGKVTLRKDLQVREGAMRRSGAITFQAEGTASAKSLRQELHERGACGGQGQRVSWGPVFLGLF